MARGSTTFTERFDIKYAEYGVPSLKDIEELMRISFETKSVQAADRDARTTSVQVAKKTQRDLKTLLDLSLQNFWMGDPRPSIEAQAYVLIAVSYLAGIKDYEAKGWSETYELAVKNQDNGTVFRQPFDQDYKSEE